MSVQKTVYRFTAPDENMTPTRSHNYGLSEAIAAIPGASRSEEEYILVNQSQLFGHGFYPKPNEWRVRVIDRVLAQQIGNIPETVIDEGFYHMVLRSKDRYVLSQTETGPEYVLTKDAVENYLQGKMIIDAGIWPRPSIG